MIRHLSFAIAAAIALFALPSTSLAGDWSFGFSYNFGNAGYTVVNPVYGCAPTVVPYSHGYSVYRPVYSYAPVYTVPASPSYFAATYYADSRHGRGYHGASRARASAVLGSTPDYGYRAPHTRYAPANASVGFGYRGDRFSSYYSRTVVPNYRTERPSYHSAPASSYYDPYDRIPDYDDHLRGDYQEYGYYQARKPKRDIYTYRESRDGLTVDHRATFRKNRLIGQETTVDDRRPGGGELQPNTYYTRDGRLRYRDAVRTSVEANRSQTVRESNELRTVGNDTRIDVLRRQVTDPWQGAREARSNRLGAESRLDSRAPTPRESNTARERVAEIGQRSSSSGITPSRVTPSRIDPNRNQGAFGRSGAVARD
ncbi:MAG: hypothetical protein RLY93_06775 [Sumerlaeia bacterium]